MMMRDMPIECCSMPMSPTVDSEKKDTHSTHTHTYTTTTTEAKVEELEEKTGNSINSTE